MGKQHSDFLQRFMNQQPAQAVLELAAPIPPNLVMQPHDIHFACAMLTSPDGKQFVLMQVATPSGVQFNIMDAEPRDEGE